MNGTKYFARNNAIIISNTKYAVVLNVNITPIKITDPIKYFNKEFWIRKLENKNAGNAIAACVAGSILNP